MIVNDTLDHKERASIKRKTKFIIGNTFDDDDYEEVIDSDEEEYIQTLQNKEFINISELIKFCEYYAMNVMLFCIAIKKIKIIIIMYKYFVIDMVNIMTKL